MKERESVFVCVTVKERERECLCVCVCVCVCDSLNVPCSETLKRVQDKETLLSQSYQSHAPL